MRYIGTCVYQISSVFKLGMSRVWIIKWDGRGWAALVSDLKVDNNCFEYFECFFSRIDILIPKRSSEKAFNTNSHQSHIRRFIHISSLIINKIKQNVIEHCTVIPLLHGMPLDLYHFVFSFLLQKFTTQKIMVCVSKILFTILLLLNYMQGNIC